MNGELKTRGPKARDNVPKKRSLQANEKENLTQNEVVQGKEKGTVRFNLDAKPDTMNFRRRIKSDCGAITQRVALSDLQQNVATKDEYDNQLKKLTMRRSNDVGCPCAGPSTKPGSRILQPTISSAAKGIQPRQACKQGTQSKTQTVSNNALQLPMISSRHSNINNVKQVRQPIIAGQQKKPIESEGNAKETTVIKEKTLGLPKTTYTSTLFIEPLRKSGKNEAKCKPLIQSARNLQVGPNKKEFRPRTKSLNVDINTIKPLDVAEVPYDKNENATACAVNDVSSPLIIAIKPIIQGVMMSPIKPNLLTSETTLLVQNAQKSAPAKKKTLKATKAYSNKMSRESLLYSDFYVSDYLEDVIQYLLQNEWRHTVGKHYLQIYDVNPLNRACVINWLLKIQGCHKISVNTYLLGIRLFDAILAAVHIPKNMYQLLSLTILWITHKFHNNTRIIRVKDLVSDCCNAYTSQQILHMEQKLLKFFNFDWNLPEPTSYVFYYLKNLDIKDEIIIDCTFYILESHTLSEEYSTEPPSLLAAAALSLTLEILVNISNSQQESIWNRLENHSGYYDIKKIKSVKDHMHMQLLDINSAEHKHYEVYNKYKTTEWFQAFERHLLALPA